jgi:methanogen homocitrate synthase
MASNHYKEGCWWTSLYNDHPEVTEGLQLPHKVEIHDATLRDGEQTPGVAFSIEDKIRIAEKLDETGVEIIEVGSPASEDNYQVMKALAQRNLKSKIFAFTQTREDVDKAADGGAYGALVEVPIGYPKLKH